MTLGRIVLVCTGPDRDETSTGIVIEVSPQRKTFRVRVFNYHSDSGDSDYNMTLDVCDEGKYWKFPR